MCPVIGCKLDLMDPVLANLIGDVAVIAAGITTGVLVARITADRTRSLERENRRLDLIAVFLRDAETLRDQGKLQAMGQPTVDWTSAQDRAHSSLTQLQILAPGLAGPALKLWQAVQLILTGAQLRTHAAGREIPPEAQDWRKLERDYEAAHAAFITAATRAFR